MVGIRRTFRYWSSRDSPSRARKAVRNAVLAWEFGDDIADVAELLTSELATNAVIHATDGREYAVDVLVSDGYLTVGVTDFGHGLPHAQHCRDDDEHGRGLAMVKDLADASGYERVPGGGKCVFFRLRVPAIPQHIRERESHCLGGQEHDHNAGHDTGIAHSVTRSGRRLVRARLRFGW
ncbi:ATP-binding protein [Streptomyces millisiae]|uniref:ATP-binding protein n=1 Tax=Streptomyces millisiae TaxID=3075542 RepID=A0ABU2LLH3_9ACTN|nr:ATP-binding protein [Streptomyces sp. DSM 44918]MDT0318421.1 ATP-binding protein [Streptomyces sp. DSM 44918]